MPNAADAPEIVFSITKFALSLFLHRLLLLLVLLLRLLSMKHLCDKNERKPTTTTTVRNRLLASTMIISDLVE